MLSLILSAKILIPLAEFFLHFDHYWSLLTRSGWTHEKNQYQKNPYHIGHRIIMIYRKIDILSHTPNYGSNMIFFDKWKDWTRNKPILIIKTFSNVESESSLKQQRPKSEPETRDKCVERHRLPLYCFYSLIFGLKSKVDEISSDSTVVTMLWLMPWL